MGNPQQENQDFRAIGIFVLVFIAAILVLGSTTAWICHPFFVK